MDIVIKGQGERTLTELVHALDKKGSINRINGIYFKDKKGNIHKNPDRKLESLDNFPKLPYHLIDVEKYITPTDFGKRSIYYYSSYGCPHRCSFCVEPAINKQRWVGLDPKKAADEITELKTRYNLDSIQIIDSNFFTSEERAIRFANRLIQNNTNIKWGNANGRIRQLNQYKKDTWKKLKKSGLNSILVGAESVDDATLKFIKKDTSSDEIASLLKTCANFDIKVFCAFMVGFPQSLDIKNNQTNIDKEIANICNTIKELNKINNRTRMMLSLYLPYPSSELFSRSQRLGLDLPNSLEKWADYLITPDSATDITIKQKWVNKNQALTVMMLSRYLFFFLDADSDKLSQKSLNVITQLGYILWKKIVLLRWKYNFFKFPIDFHLFNYLRSRVTY